MHGAAARNAFAPPFGSLGVTQSNRIDPVARRSALGSETTINKPTPVSHVHVDSSIARALNEELRRAQANLDRLAAEHAGLVANNDVIQKDRDSVGELMMQARGAVTRVETALARAQAGDYGRCTRCGEEIPAERLAALPDAERRVRCS